MLGFQIALRGVCCMLGVWGDLSLVLRLGVRVPSREYGGESRTVDGY